MTLAEKFSKYVKFSGILIICFLPSYENKLPLAVTFKEKYPVNVVLKRTGGD
jgi:uncharacterized protein (DUF1684 family)